MRKSIEDPDCVDLATETYTGNTTDIRKRQ